MFIWCSSWSGFIGNAASSQIRNARHCMLQRLMGSARAASMFGQSIECAALKVARCLARSVTSTKHFICTRSCIIRWLSSAGFRLGTHIYIPTKNKATASRLHQQETILRRLLTWCAGSTAGRAQMRQQTTNCWRRYGKIEDEEESRRAHTMMMWQKCSNNDRAVYSSIASELHGIDGSLVTIKIDS